MTKPPSQEHRGISAWLLDQPVLILVLTTAFWGGNVVAGKLAVGHIDPYSLTILRWTGALLFVLPFAIGQLKRDGVTFRRYLPLLLFYGALGYTTFNILLYVSVYFTSGVNASIEQVAVNIFVMIGNFVVFRVRVKALQVVGVVMTIVGVAMTATHGDLKRLLDLDINFGDALVLLASAAYATYSLTLRYRPPMGWMSFLVGTFLGAILAAIVYQSLLDGGIGNFVATLPEITPRGWIIVLYVLIFPSVCSQMLYVRGVELIGPNRASLFINLIPLFGTLGSVVVLGERLETFHLIAGALIVAGIVLAEWTARRASAKHAEAEGLPGQAR
ncbi:DMT family transporter [Devosia nitrariae]|uniref:Membrane protein n=1 Tax=Devosia nitrariae TaxID=2071872 RepID=A0ABQ5W9X7_9HYPH|nr:DMT family transporter [Devosia nitrariae]GLQ56730.1 membrane protein [Devosia nitrariae]